MAKKNPSTEVREFQELAMELSRASCGSLSSVSKLRHCCSRPIAAAPTAIRKVTAYGKKQLLLKKVISTQLQYFTPPSTPNHLIVVSKSSLRWVKAAERASFGSTSSPQSRQHLICSALKLDLNPDPSFLLSYAKGLLADFTRRFLSLWLGLDSGQLLRLFTASAVKAAVARGRVRKDQ